MGDVVHEENNHLEPLHWQELAVLIPIIIAIFLIGLQPAPFFDTMTASVDHVVTQVSQHIPSVAQAITP
jgi:NADH-quinone oxidoreductase subunit M